MSPLSSRQSPFGKWILQIFARNRPFIGNSSGFFYVYHSYSWFVDSIIYYTGLGGAGVTSGVATLSSTRGTVCGTNPSCAGGVGIVTTVYYCYPSASVGAWINYSVSFVAVGMGGVSSFLGVSDSSFGTVIALIRKQLSIGVITGILGGGDG